MTTFDSKTLNELLDELGYTTQPAGEGRKHVYKDSALILENVQAVDVWEFINNLPLEEDKKKPAAPPEEVHEIFGEVISCYSRKQALEDGFLADVTEWAKETGFKLPVALTESLWNLIENIPEKSGQDVRGRAYDVLFMASLAARKGASTDNQTVPFEVIVSKPGKAKYKAKLLINIGPGDKGEPVITIGFPEDF